MLVRYRDALHSSSSLPTGEHGDRVLLFPPEFNQALRALDRCLTSMRAEPELRWHTIAYFVDVEYRQTPTYRIIVRNGKRSRLPAGWTLVPVRSRGADEPKALEGVRWLSKRYPWDRVHLKALNDACGLAA